jgi:hypothetical protein
MSFIHHKCDLVNGGPETPGFTARRLRWAGVSGVSTGDSGQGSFKEDICNIPGLEVIK